MSSLQTALDAPSLVFLALTGTCSLRPSVGATLRAAIAVQIVYPDDLSLNYSYGYAFGPRIKYGAGSGTCQRQKSYMIITSPGEKSGLGPPGQDVAHENIGRTGEAVPVPPPHQ